jgi:hypothetical protein
MIGSPCGTYVSRTGVTNLPSTARGHRAKALTWGFWFGAGEGNRTLMTSLEGWGSAIELRPHDELPPP